MNNPNGKTTTLVGALIAGLLAFSFPGPAQAHCDTLDGPVILAARRALETGNVNHALVWVQPGDDAVIREAFEFARRARTGDAAVRDAAQGRFFEALVRVHRAGEGAAYTGIKPAGTPIDPAVLEADRSLETGSLEGVQKWITETVQPRLQHHFSNVLKLRNHAPDDVAAGREFVRAYVVYTHFVEGLHQAATAIVSHHGPEHAGHEKRGGHGGHGTHVPWILVGLLGLALVVETLFVFLGRKSSDG